MANRNFPNGKSIYIPHVKPVLIDCSFIVDKANGNGLGIRSLKGSYVKAVYMGTSSTPAAGNPNPQAGVILVQLADNYNRLLSIFGGQVSPLSGSNVAIDASDALLTAGNAYVITSLGTSTTADWQAVGVLASQTPAVGLAFIATSTGAGTGTGQVQVPAAAGPGIFSINGIGDANQTNSNFATLTSPGMQIMLGSYKDSASDAPVLAAMADNTVVSLCFYLNDSSVPAGTSA